MGKAHIFWKTIGLLWSVSLLGTQGIAFPPFTQEDFLDSNYPAQIKYLDDQAKAYLKEFYNDLDSWMALGQLELQLRTQFQKSLFTSPEILEKVLDRRSSGQSFEQEDLVQSLFALPPYQHPLGCTTEFETSAYHMLLSFPNHTLLNRVMQLPDDQMKPLLLRIETTTRDREFSFYALLWRAIRPDLVALDDRVKAMGYLQNITSNPLTITQPQVYQKLFSGWYHLVCHKYRNGKNDLAIAFNFPGIKDAFVKALNLQTDAQGRISKETIERIAHQQSFRFSPHTQIGIHDPQFSKKMTEISESLLGLSVLEQNPGHSQSKES